MNTSVKVIDFDMMGFASCTACSCKRRHEAVSLVHGWKCSKTGRGGGCRTMGSIRW